VPDRYHVKGSRGCKTRGLPNNAPGRDLEGFYTYPAAGDYGAESAAVDAMTTLRVAFPKHLFFVQKTPHNFDGVSIPGL
jgi:hypothetical protein